MDNHVAKENHDREKFFYKESYSINQLMDELDAFYTHVLNRLRLSDRSAKFVVNPIIYVGGKEADDSSDDEPLPKKRRYDDSLHKNIFDNLELDKNNFKALPYRQFKITKSRAEKTYYEDKFSEPVGLVRNEKVNLSENAVKIAQAFVKNLEITGLEEEDCDNIENIVYASIVLNRPLSVSTRKNNLLENKSDFSSNNTVSSPITVNITGLFWRFQWYDSSNNEVDYEVVRQFYKRLKKYDKIYGTSKAKKFKELAELGSPVPYRRLREYAKNQVNIGKLVKDYENSDVYLSIVDGDTVSFNGIYSAYKRIHSELDNPPRVMSTGYEYPRDAKCSDAFKIASQIDRKIRVITNEYIPGGVYFPEPNTCVLILRGLNTLEESFLDGSQRQDIELSCLLRNIRNEDEEATFIFNSDNPLITCIPDRARFTKTSKSLIFFSPEFIQGSLPTKKDIKNLKQVTQSHYNKSVWYNSLFINNAIKFKRGQGNQYRCKRLIAQIRKNINLDNATSELEKYIPSEVVNKIKEAAIKVNEYVATIEINSGCEDEVEDEDEDEDEDEYEHLMEDEIDEERRLIFSEPSVTKLIKHKKLSSDDIIDLKDSNTEVLEFIFDHEEIFEALYNQNIELPKLLELLNNHLDECTEALDKYSISEILERYEENPWHLHFMGEDPTDFMLANLNDDDLIEFGTEYYSNEIDFDYIRQEIRDNARMYGNPDEFSSSEEDSFSESSEAHSDDDIYREIFLGPDKVFSTMTSFSLE